MNNQTNLKPSNVYLITAVASLGGLLFGYDTAVISGAVGGLRSYFVSPLSENINIATEAIVEFKGLITICTLVIFALFSSFIFKFFKKVTAIGIMVVSILLIGSLLYSNFLSDSNELSENLGNSILGFMVSSALVGCIIGAAVGDRIANSIGRRNGLIVAALLFIISALGSAYPEKLPFLMAGNLTTFIIYRIIGGIGVGLASMLAPLYIAEMAPANMRGKLVSCNQLAIVSGMLVVYFVNYFIIKGQADDWINNIGWRCYWNYCNRNLSSNFPLWNGFI